MWYNVIVWCVTVYKDAERLVPTSDVTSTYESQPADWEHSSCKSRNVGGQKSM